MIKNNNIRLDSRTKDVPSIIRNYRIRTTASKEKLNEH